MLVIVTWLRRPAPQALSTGLSSIAADLPPFTFCTSVGCRYSFAYAVRGRLGSFLGVFRERPRRRKSLNYLKKQLLAFTELEK
jgi:hypothetical protein